VGRQIQLLLSELDMTRLEKRLLGHGDVEFLSDEGANDTHGVRKLDTIVIPERHASETSVFCTLVPRPPIGEVVVQRVSSGKHVINVNDSCVVDFWRSYCDGKVIRPGRMYYEECTLDNINKDRAFLKWANRILSRTKLGLQRDRTLQVYVGSDAQERLASGSLVLRVD
jgi:hypothetical protein